MIERPFGVTRTELLVTAGYDSVRFREGALRK